MNTSESEVQTILISIHLLSVIKTLFDCAFAFGDAKLLVVMFELNFRFFVVVKDESF